MPSADTVVQRSGRTVEASTHVAGGGGVGPTETQLGDSEAKLSTDAHRADAENADSATKLPADTGRGGADALNADGVNAAAVWSAADAPTSTTSGPSVDPTLCNALFMRSRASVASINLYVQLSESLIRCFFFKCSSKENPYSHNELTCVFFSLNVSLIQGVTFFRSFSGIGS